MTKTILFGFFETQCNTQLDVLAGGQISRLDMMVMYQLVAHFV